MHARKRAGSQGDAGEPRQRWRPRVVLFDLGTTTRVEVLDLPEEAGPGHRICHRGRNWVVIGSRTGARVLIAEPEAN